MKPGYSHLTFKKRLFFNHVADSFEKHINFKMKNTLDFVTPSLLSKGPASSSKPLSFNEVNVSLETSALASNA